MRFDDVAPVLPGSRPVARSRWEALARLGVVAVWRTTWHGTTIHGHRHVITTARPIWTIADDLGGVHHCRGPR